MVESVAASLMNECEESRGPGTSRFVTKRATISLRDYALRLASIPESSEEVWVAAKIYLLRFRQEAPAGALSETTVHKLLFTALVLATKFFDDFHSTNEAYAAVGGIRLNELNALEVEFLKCLGWKMNVQPAELSRCRCTLRAGSSSAALEDECCKGSIMWGSTCHGHSIMSGADSFSTTGYTEQPVPPVDPVTITKARGGFRHRFTSCFRSKKLTQCKLDAQ
jgi:hypothetical protein